MDYYEALCRYGDHKVALEVSESSRDKYDREDS